MKSVRSLGQLNAGISLRADDILEFHAARILLLFAICGIAGRIDSLTKLAKLDFFVRYPDFFRQACKTIGVDPKEIDLPQATEMPVESAMVRHHYGPWDKRYYQLLAYLEGCGLITTIRKGRSFNLQLTNEGKELAASLRSNASFLELCEQMKRVKKALGSKSGTWIKNLIYQTFQKEVADLPRGQSIDVM